MSARGTSGVLGMAFWAILSNPAIARADPSVCLSSHPEGTLVATYPLSKDAGFALGFIHSVSHTPVLDIYEIRAGQVVQTSEIFQAHGAGLPSMSDEIDATGWHHENGHFILDLDRPIGAMIVRIQPEYENTLHIADRSIPLASLGFSVLRIAACETQG